MCLPLFFATHTPCPSYSVHQLAVSSRLGPAVVELFQQPSTAATVVAHGVLAAVDVAGPEVLDALTRAGLLGSMRAWQVRGVRESVCFFVWGRCAFRGINEDNRLWLPFFSSHSDQRIVHTP